MGLAGIKIYTTLCQQENRKSTAASSYNEKKIEEKMKILFRMK
jgi:hypothetical protein